MFGDNWLIDVCNKISEKYLTCFENLNWKPHLKAAKTFS